jgi:hypothetical protein
MHTFIAIHSFASTPQAVEINGIPFMLRRSTRINREAVMKSFILSALFAMCFVCTGCVAGTRSTTPAALSRAEKSNLAPSPVMGVNGGTGIGTRAWPDLPIGTMRSFDSSWMLVEAKQGTWDFEVLDREVALATANKSNLDFVLTGTPTWASARPGESGANIWEEPGSRAEAANIQNWINYVTTIASRYKGRVKQYECWNEPETTYSYTGSVTSMVELCQAEYVALKAIDPTIIVASPAFGGVGSFAEGYLSKGGIGTFDVFNFHFYPPKTSPESIVPALQSVKNALASYGLEAIPLWVTETGYFIASGPNAVEQEQFPAGAYVLDSLTSQQFLARSYLVSWALGIQQSLWFCWASNEWAIVDDLGMTDKPATVAFREVAGWMEGARLLTYTETSNGTWTLSIIDRNGNPAYIVWNDQEEEEQTEMMSVPASWGVSQAHDLNGTNCPLIEGQVAVGGLPIILQ